MYKVSVGGCYTNHPAPFKMSRPYGISEFLLLFVRTRALFKVGNNEFQILPNQIIIIDKDTPYEYYAMENTYMDDWMHFSCQKQDEIYISSILNTPIGLGNGTRISIYIQQIIWEKDYGSRDHREENINMLMAILMNHLEVAVKYRDMGFEYSPYYAKMQELRLSIHSNPSHCMDVAAAADSIGISNSYFQHLYSQYFGISFRKDIIGSKMEYAKELLSGSGDTIGNIARLCGYNNEVHFYRQFKKAVGITPAEYRKST